MVLRFRPHAGATGGRCRPWCSRCISIPAPTRGATNPYFTIPRGGCISIPAPTRGATRFWPTLGSPLLFQFPPPRGGRRPSCLCGGWWSQNFNSRPHAGGDQPIVMLDLLPTNFNSRPHAGGDLFAPLAFFFFGLFQFPPPRGGRRAHAAQVRSSVDISIPAPTRGATVDAGDGKGVDLISIPAPTRGATHIGDAEAGGPDISIPAPTRGATSGGCRQDDGCSYFNSRPHAGGDSKNRQKSLRFLLQVY